MYLYLFEKFLVFQFFFFKCASAYNLFSFSPESTCVERIASVAFISPHEACLRVHVCILLFFPGLFQDLSLSLWWHGDQSRPAYLSCGLAGKLHRILMFSDVCDISSLQWILNLCFLSAIYTLLAVYKSLLTTITMIDFFLVSLNFIHICKWVLLIVFFIIVILSFLVL